MVQASALLALPIIILFRIGSAIFWSVSELAVQFNFALSFYQGLETFYFVIFFFSSLLNFCDIIYVPDLFSKKAKKPTRNAHTNHARRKAKRVHPGN